MPKNLIPVLFNVDLTTCPFFIGIGSEPYALAALAATSTPSIEYFAVPDIAATWHIQQSAVAVQSVFAFIPLFKRLDVSIKPRPLPEFNDF